MGSQRARYARFAVGRGLTVLPAEVFGAPSRALPTGVFTSQRWLGGVVGRRYYLESPLGHGGQGQVFVARVLPGLERVAVKIYQGSDSSRGAWREAMNAAALQHPRVVRLRDIGQCRDAGYIVTDMYPGRTLRRQVALAPLSIPATVRLAEELADALNAAWDAQMIHGDVTPRNVVLGAEGAKLVDLGLAALLHERRRGGGTLGFAAPEVLGHDAATGAAADVFGLGATLWFACTGQAPFAAPSWGEYVTSVRERRLMGAERIDDARLANLLVWMLDPRPRDRPQGHELRELVDRLGAGQGTADRASYTTQSRDAE